MESKNEIAGHLEPLETTHEAIRQERDSRAERTVVAD
jgi:hypothetical protein